MQSWFCNSADGQTYTKDLFVTLRTLTGISKSSKVSHPYLQLWWNSPQIEVCLYLPGLSAGVISCICYSAIVFSKMIKMIHAWNKVHQNRKDSKISNICWFMKCHSYVCVCCISMLRPNIWFMDTTCILVVNCMYVFLEFWFIIDLSNSFNPFQTSRPEYNQIFVKKPGGEDFWPF